MHLCSSSCFLSVSFVLVSFTPPWVPVPPLPGPGSLPGQTDEGHVPNRWGCHWAPAARDTGEAISDVHRGCPGAGPASYTQGVGGVGSAVPCVSFRVLGVLQRADRRSCARQAVGAVGMREAQVSSAPRLSQCLLQGCVDELMCSRAVHAVAPGTVGGFISLLGLSQ